MAVARHPRRAGPLLAGSSTIPDGHRFIIVPQDASDKTLADSRGKRIVPPNPAAFMTQLCTAELRTRAATCRE